MSNWYYRVLILTKSQKLRKYLFKKFTSDNLYRVDERYLDNAEYSYALLDLTSGYELEDIQDFIGNLKSKTLVVILDNQTILEKQLLRLNQNISVIKVNRGSKEAFYGKSLIKEMLSFGHDENGYVMPPDKIYSIRKERTGILVPEIVEKQKSEFLPKKQLSKLNYINILRKIKYPLYIILLLLILPWMFIVVSTAALFTAKQFILASPSRANNLINFSRQTANISAKVDVFSINNEEIPSYILRLGNIAKDTNSLFGESQKLFDRLLNGEVEGETLGNIPAYMESIYNELGFLESSLEKRTILNKLIINYLSKRNYQLNEIRERIYQAKQIASRLPNLLGYEKPVKYLILFQNNMELRPTGGFIGSFAIISIENGKLVDINVSDVYSADGQLKGYVEPPKPLVDYLNQPAWYLRDSNWDPDFSVSAERAEWFLEKELGIKVDGVAAIDLFFVKDILLATGEIYLPDYNKKVDADNLYQETQSQAEDNFFPGSKNKENFLTALSRQLIIEIKSLSKDKLIYFAGAIVKGLEEKHLQLYIHDINIKKSVDAMAYGGRVDTKVDCGESCLIDSYMVVDANVGVNKSNYFLKRSQKVNITVNRSGVDHQLEIDYQNNAAVQLGDSGKYKSYTRLILPPGTTDIIVSKYEYGKDVDVIYDDLKGNNSEIGFLVEVLPSTKGKYKVSWRYKSENLYQGGEYDLKVFKQAGTDNEPLSIVFNVGDLQYTYSRPVYSLTDTGLPSYNTSLGRDFSARILVK